MDDMAIRILDDLESVLYCCGRIREDAKDIRNGNTWDLDNFDPFSFAIYCEFAFVVLDDITTMLATIIDRVERGTDGNT